MDEIISNDIHIYQFPTSDESVAELNRKMNVSSSSVYVHVHVHVHLVFYAPFYACHPLGNFVEGNTL